MDNISHLRILLLMLKELVMYCAVNLTLHGSFRTDCSFEFAGRVWKSFGKVILLNQRALSTLYASHENRKWVSFSTGSKSVPLIMTSWFWDLQTRHFLSTSGILGIEYLPVSRRRGRHPSLVLAILHRWWKERGLVMYTGCSWKFLKSGNYLLEIKGKIWFKYWL